MTNAEVLDKAIRYLRLRCGAAYRAKDDDLLLKIVPVLCKAVEMQQKLSGAEDAALWLLSLSLSLLWLSLPGTAAGSLSGWEALWLTEAVLWPPVPETPLR